MYLDFFGLKAYPFRLTPDGEFLYMSHGHARAKAYMDYGVVSRDGFVVVTGEIGAGKTTLINKLVSELPDDVIPAVITQPQLDDFEFLQALMAELGFSRVEAGKVELINQLREFVTAKYREGFHILLVVDEAQSLGYKVLEQIRFLSGLEANRDKLISVILAGQPELGRVLESAEMAQLLQRVRLRFHLAPMTPDETRAYIAHRLSVAGARRDDLFQEDAFAVIDEYAGGIPRLINSLCDMAMLTAYVDGQEVVDDRIVQSAVSELGWTRYADRAGDGDGRSLGARAATASEIAFADADRRLFEELNSNLAQLVELLAESTGEIREDLASIRNRLEALEEAHQPEAKPRASGKRT